MYFYYFILLFLFFFFFFFFFQAEDGIRDGTVTGVQTCALPILAVKLSPVLPDIPAMAAVAKEAGADAVTLVNTIPGALEGRLGNGTGGVSGPALLPVGVLATRRVRAAVDIPVIGAGGVRTVDDARA